MKDGNAKAPFVGVGVGDKALRYMERLKGHVLFSEKLLHAFQDGVLRRVCESVL